MTTRTASITPDLIGYMAKDRTSPIPSPVLAKAKHHILDTVAAMVSGTTIKPGVFAIRYIDRLLDSWFENFARFLAGKRLRNLIDRRLGY